MNTFLPKTPSHRLFRGAVLAFAVVLGCQATWILAAEFSRAPLPDFPSAAQAALATAANRNAAAQAASFGFIRGDLWANYAVTYLDLLQGKETDSDQTQVAKTVNRAWEIANRTLALAPHDARVWLVLAGIGSQFDWLNHNPAAALRMSYYTGANETELIPLRLRLAVSSPALVDKDFQELVRHDIRIIVTRKPELISAILSAYRDAMPPGRQFLEKTLNDIDPSLSTKLRLKG